MKVVYKYDLMFGLQTIDLPIGAEIVSAATRKPGFSTEFNMWAIVDPSAETEPRRFYLAATGEQIPEEGTNDGGIIGFEQTRAHYIDTILEGEEYLVWHLFELILE